VIEELGKVGFSAFIVFLLISSFGSPIGSASGKHSVTSNSFIEVFESFGVLQFIEEFYATIEGYFFIGFFIFRVV